MLFKKNKLKFQIIIPTFDEENIGKWGNSLSFSESSPENSLLSLLGEGVSSVVSPLRLNLTDVEDPIRGEKLGDWGDFENDSLSHSSDPCIFLCFYWAGSNFGAINYNHTKN